MDTKAAIASGVVAFAVSTYATTQTYYAVLNHIDRKHNIFVLIALNIFTLCVMAILVLLAIEVFDPPQILQQVHAAPDSPTPISQPPPAPEVIKPTQPETRLPDRRRDAPDEPPKPAVSNPPQSIFAQKPTCETAIDQTEIPVSISVTGPSEISSEDVERSLEAQVPRPFRVVQQPECSALNISAFVKLSTTPESIKSQTAHYVIAATDINFRVLKTQREKHVSSTYSESFIDQDYKDDYSDWPKRSVISQSIRKALLGFDSVGFLSSTFRIKITGLAPAEDSTSQCAAR